jgi:hypothetical protein
MTSCSEFPQQQQPNQDIGELTAALSAIMDRLHADPSSFLNQPLDHWNIWLSGEGYNVSSVADWLLEFTKALESDISSEQLVAFYRSGLANGVTTGDSLDALANSAPVYVEAVQARMDILLEADEQAKQVAGGKGLDARPAYLLEGAAAVATVTGLAYVYRKGYVGQAYNFTKKKTGELWSWATSTAQDAKTIASDDVRRDLLHPVDAVRQAEVIAPAAPTVALDVEKLDQATMPDIRAAAASYARKDIDSMFTQSKIANAAWYEESKSLIKDTAKIDKDTYIQLKNACGDGFNQTELSRRFDFLDLKGIDRVVYEGGIEAEYSFRNAFRIAGDPRLEMLKSRLGNQLQASYEHVLCREVAEAKRVAGQDVIEVNRSIREFEDEIRAKAIAACAAVRSEAVTQLNGDMQRAREAAAKAGSNFVDVEKHTIADFEEGFDDIEEI